jgi:hypothetical protein
MPVPELDDAELAAVVAALKGKDRYPRDPRLEPFRSALAKLDPGSAPRPIAPGPPPPTRPSVGNRRGKGRR